MASHRVSPSTQETDSRTSKPLTRIEKQTFKKISQIFAGNVYVGAHKHRPNSWSQGYILNDAMNPSRVTFLNELTGPLPWLLCLWSQIEGWLPGQASALLVKPEKCSRQPIKFCFRTLALLHQGPARNIVQSSVSLCESRSLGCQKNPQV